MPPIASPASVDVLLVCAMKDEYDQVLKVSDGLLSTGWQEQTTPDRWKVAVGEFATVSGPPLRILTSHAVNMGREAVSALVSKLFHFYPAHCLAMSGICAGRRYKLSLGDVIFANLLWSYDAGKTTVENGITKFQADPLQYRPSDIWIQRMQSLTIDPGSSWLVDRPALSLEYQEDWVLLCCGSGSVPSQHPDRKGACPDWIPVLECLWKRQWLEQDSLNLTPKGREQASKLALLHLDGLRDTDPFKIHTAPLASGADVREEAGLFDRLSESMRKILGIDMEASVLGALAHAQNIPVLVAKGVQDYGDTFKDDRYRTFAARASAECLIALLRNNADLLPGREASATTQATPASFPGTTQESEAPPFIRDRTWGKLQPGVDAGSLDWQKRAAGDRSSSTTSQETRSSIPGFDTQPCFTAPLSPELLSQVTAIVIEQIKQAGIIQMPRETAAADSIAEDPVLHAKIDVYRDLFKDDHKQLLPAQREFLKLLESEALDGKPWARFRIETNLGAIAFGLGKESEGITRYETAYAIRPDDAKAITNLALARTLQGRFDEAMELAQRALETEPRADYAVCYLLQAAAACSYWQGDPETLIPADLIGSEPADIGLAEFLRRRNAPGWAERTLELSHRHPETEVFKRLKAMAILSLAVGDEGITVHPGTVPMADLNAAADELKALAERYLDIGYADPAELSAYLNNTGAAFRLTDRHAECEALLSRGLEKVPPDPVLIRLLASAQAVQGRRAAAIATLESDPDPENQLLKAELISLDNPTVALEALLKIDPTPLKPRLACHRWEMIGELALKTGKMEILESAVVALREQFPTEISADLLALRGEKQAGMGQEAVHEWLQAIASGLPPDVDMATRYFLAEEMRGQGLPEEASKLLEGFVSLERNHPPTILYLQSLAEARRDQAFRDAIAAAAPAVREAPAILWTIAIHAWHADDLATAYSAIERLLAHAPEVAMARRLKIEILIRQDRATEVRAELDKPVEALDWTRTEEACRIASLLAHFGYIERAVAFAYRLFLGHRDEAPAWMALLSILLSPRQVAEDSAERWRVETVAPDAAVDLLYDDGMKSFFIVEPDAGLRQLDQDSWEPGHRLVKSLTGLRAGERFKGADGREGMVVQLRHKYIARLNYITERYEKRFPEIFGIRRITVDPTQPDWLDQLIAELKANSESVAQEQEQYLREGWPLGVSAHRLGQDTIDVAAGFARQGIPLKVAVGREEDRNEAFRAVLQNARKGCVLDLWTLWTAWRLRALEVVAEICGSIHLPQSVMDRLRYRRETIDLSSRDGLRSASYEDGRMAVLEVAPEVLREWRDDLDELIAWAENHTTIHPLVLGEDLPSELRQFYRDGDSDLFDSLTLARQEGVLLVSDDLVIRNIGRTLAGVPSVWLHPLFWMGRERGLIDLDTLTRWTAALVEAGQDYTSVTGKMLVRALQLDAAEGVAPGYYFKTLTRAIGGKTAKPVSHLSVCAECLHCLWMNARAVSYRASATGLLLRQLIHDRQSDYIQTLRVLFNWAWPLLPLRDYLWQWAQGHCLLQDILAENR